MKVMPLSVDVWFDCHVEAVGETNGEWIRYRKKSVQIYEEPENTERAILFDNNDVILEALQRIEKMDSIINDHVGNASLKSVLQADIVLLKQALASTLYKVQA